MREALVSIIIPIYNAEKFLKRCLESIRYQTYQNIEVILVDDGSTDNSGKIADEYSQADLRFQVFHLENGGVSRARNYGLKASKGEYIAFVDADDLVDSHYIEHLYKFMIEESLLVSVCKAFFCKDVQINSYECKVLSGEKEVKRIKEYDYSKDYAHCTVWGTIMRRDAIGDTVFANDLYIGEDALFFATVLEKCEKVGYLYEQLYAYIVYPESSSRGCYDEKKKTEVIAWRRIQDVFKSYPQTFLKNVNARYCIECVNGIKKMTVENCVEQVWYDYLLVESRKYIFDLLTSSYSVSRKLSTALYCLFPSVCGRVHKVIKR